MLKIIPAATLSAAMISLVLATGAANAQDDQKLPPQNAKKLSDIIAKVEQRDGFRYIGEIDWSDGAYTVTYYTADKAKVEINFDPVSGEPK